MNDAPVCGRLGRQALAGLLGARQAPFGAELGSLPSGARGDLGESCVAGSEQHAYCDSDVGLGALVSSPIRGCLRPRHGVRSPSVLGAQAGLPCPNPPPCGPLRVICLLGVFPWPVRAQPAAFAARHFNVYKGDADGEHKMKFAKGTTTLAFKFKGGVIVAVDSRSTQGPYIGEDKTARVSLTHPVEMTRVRPQPVLLPLPPAAPQLPAR